jgi:transporter family protein
MFTHKGLSMWLAYAAGAAVAGATFITITKAGLSKVDPTLALGVQASVSLLVAWGAVFYRGKFGSAGELGGKDWGLLLLCGAISGLASVLLFLALKDGPASRVTPIDRLSFLVAAVLAALFLGEKITWQVGTGLGLMAVGAAIIALSKTE